MNAEAAERSSAGSGYADPRPLVSILVPAYNSGRTIAQTIQSALAQTWSRKEVVVVDDGSTDDTLAIARTFSAENVLVLGKDNEGAAATRNHAMSLCQGDYLQWLDADDLLAPDKIESQLDLLKTDSDPLLLLSGSWGRFAFRPQRALFEPTSLWRDLSPVEWLIRKLGGNVHMQTATWLTSRKLAEDAGPWDPRMEYDDDGEYFCRVLLKSKGTRFARDAKVYWRDIPGARLSFIGNSDRKMDALLLSMKLHIQYLRSMEDSGRVREACRAYIENCAISFHPRRGDLLLELKEMGRQLDVRVQLPSVRRKYAWMAPLFGESFAWESQLTIPRVRARAMCELDRLLSVVERKAELSATRVGSGK